MSLSNTEINQGDNSIAVVDNSRTKTVEKTVNVERNIEKTVIVDTTMLEEGQKAILDEIVKIGQQLREIADKGLE